MSDVERWFDDYRRIFKELNITSRRNIINFDEAGFRVGCMKGHEILVPSDISEFYAISPENRRSLTIFECNNAAGDYPPPPLLIIQGRDVMSSWFAEGLPAKTLVMTSDSGFTSDKIAIDFLNHYIANSDAGPNADWKLMLMDNHGSHCTPEFIMLANENHIRPYPLIPHLTHCMQPLDVGIFQPYKHWHDVAIQEAFAEFNTEYSLVRFCQDLTKIRNNTFKASTIRSAFKKAGMWPVNSSLCIEQVKKFAAPDVDDPVHMLHGQQRKPRIERTTTETSLLLPILPRVQPQTFHDVQQGLAEWLPKVQNTLWSDPSRPQEFEEFINNTKKIVAKSELNAFELKLLYKRKSDELLQKATSRKRLKSNQSLSGGLGLIKEDAERAIAEKQLKKKEAEKRKSHNNFMKMWRMERDQKHVEGVAARKDEKARVKNIKDLMKQEKPIPGHLLTPIEDPEAVWKTTNHIWLEEEAKKDAAKRQKGRHEMDEGDEEDDDVTFITEGSNYHNRRFITGHEAEAETGVKDDEAEEDAIRDQDDFIAFGEDDDDDDDDINQELLGW